MKIDFHFHLEEGPYSFGWLQRTAQALYAVSPEVEEDGAGAERHTLEWMKRTVARLQQRLESGSFSDEWLAHYLRIGKERGIRQFGIVDHLYRFVEFKPYYEKYMTLDDSPLGKLQRYWLDRVCMDSIESFLAVVRRAQQAGEPISVGVEADYFPGGEDELRELLGRYELDYVIGSVHFNDGWGFDNPEVKDRFEQQDLHELYASHYQYVIGAVRSGLFDIVAHLDNMKVFGYRPDEATLQPHYEAVAQALAEADVATEINTGLAYRYPVKEPCPSPSFLAVLNRHGVRISMGSDSHYPDDIGMMLDEAAELLRQAGYSQLATFRGRVRTMVPLD